MHVEDQDFCNRLMKLSLQVPFFVYLGLNRQIKMIYINMFLKFKRIKIWLLGNINTTFTVALAQSNLFVVKIMKKTEVDTKRMKINVYSILSNDNDRFISLLKLCRIKQ